MATKMDDDPIRKGTIEVNVNKTKTKAKALEEEKSWPLRINGGESWVRQGKNESEIDSVKMWFPRSELSLKDKYSVSDVPEQCGLKKDVVIRVESVSLLWFSHLSRSESSTCHRIAESSPTSNLKSMWISTFGQSLHLNDLPKVFLGASGTRPTTFLDTSPLRPPPERGRQRKENRLTHIRPSVETLINPVTAVVREAARRVTEIRRAFRRAISPTNMTRMHYF
ncbi:hypothetical protein EVAR_74195_1 [Eumeta japonica]|uniref:Uncharacterized protein n=1 Tax=Eumeta variegata TaxID=151549 RepID=A0A4C1SCE2_EUMVA|nr:hypothetical protein EVAR_74195_1 [Eumeta japonica]